MSLTSLWNAQKGELASKRLQAMVGLAGDGKLRDGSEASKEFREFLTHVPSEMLVRYANECLREEKFAEGCYALQDLVNEAGRRLGFTVQNGLYRGKTKKRLATMDFGLQTIQQRLSSKLKLQTHFHPSSTTSINIGKSLPQQARTT